MGLAAATVLTLVALTAVALRQARLADDQRARAEQVTGFVTGFLGATPTGPDWALQNKGVSLRVVELADDIGARIGGELATQPEAEATLRSVLAMTYYQMGEIAKSQAHAERAIALYDQVYPRDDPRRFSVELVQAGVENSLGRFAAAEARTKDVAARWRDMPAAASSVYTSQLGIAQLRLGKVDAAEATFRQGITTVEQALGANHPSLGLVASNFALVFLERGQFEEAARWLERAAAISRAAFKEASMPLAWALVNLSNAYRFMGEIDKSLAAATESLAQFEGALGPNHFSTIHALASIAYAKAVRGDDDAETFIRRGIANQASLPPDNYERAVGLNFLGVVLMHEGHLAEARAALSQALEVRRRTFTAPNWRIAETAGWLGETLARDGRQGRGAAAAAGKRRHLPDAVRRRQPPHRRRPRPPRPGRSRPTLCPLRVFTPVFRHMWMTRRLRTAGVASWTPRRRRCSPPSSAARWCWPPPPWLPPRPWHRRKPPRSTRTGRRGDGGPAR